MSRRALAALWLSLAVSALAQEPLVTPAEHRRTPDQTFLTFPEWYLVHSPAEYAAYLAHTQHPSAFPLFAHIGQFWQSYAAVTHEIARWPFNAGYHLMVLVIGTSTTVEYTLKGLYEHTLGRLAEATRSSAGDAVPEERFAARYAQSYVDSIRIDPWYRYDFMGQLQQLWQDVPLRGPDLLRRWERRYVLTSELLVKAGYARLIGLGTQTIYDAPKPTTAVLLSRPPQADPQYPGLKLLAPPRGDGTVLASVPRYQAFTEHAAWLASQGLDFVEIAGNRGDVLVSAWAPTGWRPDHGRVLFRQPLLTRPGTERVAFAVPVAGLAAQLRAAAAPAVFIEHVYDF